MKVSELRCGDVIRNGPAMSATFIGRSQHPTYPALQAVVWLLPNGGYSIDALDARQEVGEFYDRVPADELKAILAGRAPLRPPLARAVSGEQASDDEPCDVCGGTGAFPMVGGGLEACVYCRSDADDDTLREIERSRVRLGEQATP